MEEEELKEAIEEKISQIRNEKTMKITENLYRLENDLRVLKAELKGFHAGQLAEREKFYYWLFDLKKGQKKWSTYQLIKIQKKLEELTKKVSEDKR